MTSNDSSPQCTDQRPIEVETRHRSTAPKRQRQGVLARVSDRLPQRLDRR
jgi:hypothetical protein